MATARKLKSGSWRCLVYDYTDENGKRKYKSFTASTKKEAEYNASKYLTERITGQVNNYTVGDCITAYIKAKEEILSPTTIRGYLSLSRSSYGEIINRPVLKLSMAELQAWIGNLTFTHSAKTVRNIYGLFSAAINMFYPTITFNVTLPQLVPPDLYVPTDDDIKEIMDYFSEDIDMTNAICLSAFGSLRRSEVCGINIDTDLNRDTNTIYIHQAMVLDKRENEFIIKDTTKNKTSTRYVQFPQFVIDSLPSHGMAVNLSPSIISDRFAESFKYTGLPKFRFHDLRHYTASIMHAIGVPDAYIMKRGGWKTDVTLKKVYRKTMDDYERTFSNKTNEYFSNMQHKMQHKNKNP